ncbi:NAD-dependent DNA ligase LigA [Streptomyces sp. NPDC090127]|uniref:NAD-dependent DNA ligase LigA n=1 Tax=Streptomyces sp. NPDC090127 TaxID=3365953 RepID=UPI003800570F
MDPMTTTPVLADTAAYAQAVEDAKRAAAAYYAGGTSPLDDDAYDHLARAIAAWEADHPQEVRDDTPTGKVAGGAATGDVPHTRAMLSLDNVFSAEQFTAWVASLERRIGRPVERWSVEPKLDGLAIAARYDRGRLARLVTRGDGTAGEDVSHAIGTIVGLPGHLTEPLTVEVRGEVLMTTEQFEAANPIRVAHGGEPFANPRNAAAGTLRAKDRPYRVEMTFFAYDLLPLDPAPGEEGTGAGPGSGAGAGAGVGGDLGGAADVGGVLGAGVAGLGEAAHSELLARAVALGLHTSGATAVPGRTVTGVAEVLARVAEIAALRAELPFGIDGIVVKADLAADRREAGEGSRAPRWAIAYKLPAVEKVTRLLAVEWNVGRTGVIAPRAVLEPVEIDGSTVTYATLHNPSDITRRDLRLGDRVMVHKAGDIIPRVEAPVAQLRTGEERPIEFPEACPQCGSEIDRSEQRWRCARGRNCHLVAALSYAVGRDQLDIEGLGATRIVQLVDAALVADVADLFTLTREQLLGLERMGETSADNLLAALATARTRPLSRVLCALGIRGTGRSMSRRIARHFATMDAVRSADAEAMRTVAGIGAEKAPVIVAELTELGPVVDKLVAAGVNMTEPGATPPPPPGTASGTDLSDPSDPSDTATDAVPAAGSAVAPASPAVPAGPLAGLSVVVTGAMTGPLEALTRNQMNELIERAGGRSSSSVSRRTGLVVAGEKAGSKRAKAEDLGVRLVAPEAFAELLGDFLPA